MPKKAVEAVLHRHQTQQPTEDIRVIGFRRDGQVLEAELTLHRPRSDKNDSSELIFTAVFPDASLAQLKEIKLQHRAYAWIEFGDVALQPGKSAAKETSPPTAPPSGGEGKPRGRSTADAASGMPLRRFDPGFPVGMIALSPDGKLIAAANVGPTRLGLRGGTGVIADNWRPVVKLFDTATGKTVVPVKFTTKEEDALDSENVTPLEIAVLAFSPDGKVVAVGTRWGHLRLCDADRRTAAVSGG